MKHFFRVSVLGLLLLAITVAFAPSSYGQSPDEQKEKEAIYKKYTDNYAGTIEQRKIAIAAGNEYIQKYGANEADADLVNYLKTAVKDLEQGIKEEQEAAAKAAAAKAKADERKARLARFDKAYKKDATSDWNEVFTAGDAIIANDQDLSLDVKILLASAGSAYLVEKNPPVTIFIKCKAINS